MTAASQTIGTPAPNPKLKKIRMYTIGVCGLVALGFGAQYYAGTIVHARDLWQAAHGDTITALEKTPEGYRVTLEDDGDVKMIHVRHKDIMDHRFEQSIIDNAQEHGINVSVQVVIPGAKPAH